MIFERRLHRPDSFTEVISHVGLQFFLFLLFTQDVWKTLSSVLNGWDEELVDNFYGLTLYRLLTTYCVIFESKLKSDMKLIMRYPVHIQGLIEFATHLCKVFFFN